MRRFLISFALLILAALAACASAPAAAFSAAPTRIVPPAGMGGIAGRVPAALAAWPEEAHLFIYAAPFYGKDGEGFYTLEPSIHPSAGLDAGGYFQLGSVAPGSYVLVVGPAAEEGRLVVDAQAKLRVVEVRPADVNELGDLPLAP